jgi:hypothetical protein
MNNVLKTYIEYWRKHGNARRAIELTAREMGLTIKQVEKEIEK